MPITHISSTHFFREYALENSKFSGGFLGFGERRVVFNTDIPEIPKDLIPDYANSYGTEKVTPANQEQIILDTRVSKALQLNKLKSKAQLTALKDSLKNSPSLAESVQNIIEKKIKTFSAEKLLMIEEIFPGTLKNTFVTSDGTFDFKENKEAESLIGLGDMLPLSQTYIVIYDERTGEWEAGVRGIKNTSMGPRPAYLNIGSSSSDKKNAKKPPSKPGDYIEILDGYRITNISGLAGIEAFEKDIATSDIQNKISKDEAIFDTKVLNEKGESVNTQADIAKNETVKKDWIEGLGTMKLEKKHYYSENFTNRENLSSHQDIIDMAREMGISNTVIKTFLFTMGSETGKKMKPFENGRFIRTRAGEGTSSAYGPLQLTRNLARDYAKRHKGLFNEAEHVFLKTFDAQGTAMLNAKNDNNTYGLGKSGEPYFREQESKILYFQICLKMFNDHVVHRANGDPLKGMELWRGKKQNQDPQYFKGLQTALEKTLPVTQKKAEQISDTEKIPEEKKTSDLIAPYIDIFQPDFLETIKKNEFPSIIWLKNQKYPDAQRFKTEVQSIIKFYTKNKKTEPTIAIDNETGTVQRLKDEYNPLSIEGALAQRRLSKTFHNGRLERGNISIEDVEAELSKNTQKRVLIQKYAQLRVAQEKSLGLNSIQLVLDQKLYHGKEGNINSERTFTNPENRKVYALALAHAAAKEGMTIIPKHFPPNLEKDTVDTHHHGLTRSKISKSGEIMMNIITEMQEIKGLKMKMMLGHIKIEEGPFQTRDSAGNLVTASQSITLAQYLRENYNGIELISDDIGSMDSVVNKDQARKNAREAEITVLN